LWDVLDVVLVYHCIDGQDTKLQTIIAVDRFTTRLELAESVGATHTINTAVPEFDFQQALRDISPPGASVVVNTTGVGWLIEKGLKSLAPLGKMVHIASPPPDYRLSLDVTDLFSVRLLVLKVIAL
jgi:Zn-dependent alcohol dehydrogenase